MTDQELAVVSDFLRDRFDEATAARMLRAAASDIEAESTAEGERAGRSYWMTGVTQVLDPADRLRLTEDEIFAALEHLARPPDVRVAALRYATRAR